MSNAELAVSYASLILADDEVDITVSNIYIYNLLSIRCVTGYSLKFYTNKKILRTLQADKLQTLLKAANVSDVEPIWTTLFSKV